MAGPCFHGDVKRSDFERALTPERAAGLWKFARDNYFDKGVKLEDALTDMADKFGMPREWVAVALTKNKRLVKYTNDLFKLQEDRRAALRSAKHYVQTIDAAPGTKALTVALAIPRRVLTFGHGVVFPVTHALDLAGSEWTAYARLTARSWASLNKVQHAKLMDAIRSDDKYAFWRKAKLEIDPDSGPQGILSGGVGNTSWSRRSWDMLKVTRLELAKDRLAALPELERTPEMAKYLASQINHATGVMSSGEWNLGAVSKGMFAPQLTMSKIAKTFVDPAKTLGTYSKVALGYDVPFAERNIASLRLRKATKAAASMLGLLAVNQGLNVAFGRKDRVNFTDPGQSDWLRPKAFGHTLNTRGSMELVRLIGNAIRISQADAKALHGETRTAASRKRLADYAAYKIDPSLSLLGEAAFGEDAFGRPLPWTANPGSKARPKYSWAEYAATKGPIYFGGAAREIYDTLREEGLSASDTTAIMRNLWRGAIVGAGEAIGGGIQRAHEPKQSPVQYAPPKYAPPTAPTYK